MKNRAIMELLTLPVPRTRQRAPSLTLAHEPALGFPRRGVPIGSAGGDHRLIQTLADQLGLGQAERFGQLFQTPVLIEAKVDLFANHPGHDLRLRRATYQ
jgi:hypothetical protein